jgi:rSAM/selenodomain-associated transferase 2
MRHKKSCDGWRVFMGGCVVEVDRNSVCISIVVPVLNERAALPHLIERLLLLQDQGCEVLLADGGSDDGSVSLIQAAGLQVVPSARGRARQMNSGAMQAQGDVLLFLHADTELPADAIACVLGALRSGAHQWGRFDVRIRGHHWMLRVVATLMNLRSRLTGVATGDQALFVCRHAFNAVGGFADQPLMEDIAMSKQLLRLSRPACIARRVTTSGRRWETRGVWRTIVLMWRLRWLYWRGVAPEILAHYYR